MLWEKDQKKLECVKSSFENSIYFLSLTQKFDRLSIVFPYNAKYILGDI